MESEYKILNQITPENANPYSIPPVEYFNGFADAILVKIKSKEVIYQTPQNYFDNLSTEILQKVKQQEKNTEIVEELKLIAPLLNTINKQNIYSVSNNYFEALHPNPLNKNVKLHLPTKWLKYAVAAVFTGAIVVGVIVTNDKNKQQIASYNQAIKTNIEQSLINITDDELTKNLEAEKALVNNTNEPFFNQNNLQEEVRFVSDDEIENYIKENKIEDVENNSPNS